MKKLSYMLLLCSGISLWFLGDYWWGKAIITFFLLSLVGCLILDSVETKKKLTLTGFKDLILKGTVKPNIPVRKESKELTHLSLMELGADWVRNLDGTAIYKLPENVQVEYNITGGKIWLVSIVSESGKILNCLSLNTVEEFNIFMELCGKALKIGEEKQKIVEGKWIEDLTWCPSQCYYYFREQNTNNLMCIYLRWKNEDPWNNPKVVKCFEDGTFIYESTRTVELQRTYSAQEYQELEEDALKTIL